MQNPPTVNYFCTWHWMNWFFKHSGKADFRVSDIMCDEFLFGTNGIAVRAYPKVRGELYFLMCMGWDAASSCDGTLTENQYLLPYLSSFLLDEQKFPNYGYTPEERLKTLSDKLKELGWKGLGLNVSPSMAYAQNVPGADQNFTDYWRTRLEWSKYAGVSYWQVDKGCYERSDKHRKILSQLNNQIYPELIMEHSVARDQWNRGAMYTERGIYKAIQRHRLSYSDVYRIYNVTFPLSIPTSLLRVAELFKYPPKLKDGCMGIINVGDEVYLGAALGLSLKISRYDIGNESFDIPPNMSFGGHGRFAASRPARKQLDEAARAVRWQADFAPPYSVDWGSVTALDEYFLDTWKFKPHETWATSLAKGGTLVQAAPKILARNIESPKVIRVVSDIHEKKTAETQEVQDIAVPTEGQGNSFKAVSARQANSLEVEPEKPVRTTPLRQLKKVDGNMPYLVAARNPNGAISIAVLGRVSVQNAYSVPLADVSWVVGALSGDIGIFGSFNSLEMWFDNYIMDKQILAKDLLADEFVDITNEIVVEGNRLVLSRQIIEKYGLMNASDGDLSQPAMVVRIGDVEEYKKVIIPIAWPYAPFFNAGKLLRYRLMAGWKTMGARLKIASRKSAYKT